MSEEQVVYINAHKSSVKWHATRTAAASAAFLIPHLEALAPTFKFLDLGCGPGSITIDMAQRFPSATFLGIDAAEAPITQANATLKERKISNASFKVGDILKLSETDLDWGSFDVVFCHAVLLHMQRPVDGLKVMQRAAKPAGGIVAARESFLSGQLFFPDPDGLLKRYGRTVGEMLKRNGSDPEIGAKLVEKAKEAGWKRSQIQASCSTYELTSEQDKAAFGTHLTEMISDPESGARKRALAAGLVDEEILKQTVEAVKRWMADDAAWGAYVSRDMICINDL